MHYSISDYLLDMVQNAIESEASTITVELSECPQRFSISVRDDGCGMDCAQLARAMDPFYSNGTKHPGRKVGLGLPFLKQASDALQGSLDIHSKPGAGTSIAFNLPKGGIDSPPIGDPVGSLVLAMTFIDTYELRVTRHKSDGEYWAVCRSELADALGELESVDSLSLLREYFESLEGQNGKNDA